MHELLEIADLMVTKPGGISLTEAAVKVFQLFIQPSIMGKNLKMLNTSQIKMQQSLFQVSQN